MSRLFCPLAGTLDTVNAMARPYSLPSASVSHSAGISSQCEAFHASPPLPMAVLHWYSFPSFTHFAPTA